MFIVFPLFLLLCTELAEPQISVLFGCPTNSLELIISILK